MVKRLYLRLQDDLYNSIVELAEQQGAKVNVTTGKLELTKTATSLLKKALDPSANIPTNISPSTSINTPTNISAVVYANNLESRIKALEEKYQAVTILEERIKSLESEKDYWQKEAIQMLSRIEAVDQELDLADKRITAASSESARKGNKTKTTYTISKIPYLTQDTTEFSEEILNFVKAIKTERPKTGNEDIADKLLKSGICAFEQIQGENIVRQIIKKLKSLHY